MNTEIAIADEERVRCEIWSRVMRYHRPVSSWNVGKQREHADRLHFREGAMQMDVCTYDSGAD